LCITVHPDSLAPIMVESVDLLLAVGAAPEKTVAGFCKAAGRPSPLPLSPSEERGRGEGAPVELATGEALAWRPASDAPPARIRTEPPHGERVRHSRKYAEGSVGPERSFVFRGPEGKLNLKA